MSIEIISNSLKYEIHDSSKTYKYLEMESELNKAEKSIDETRAELKISNQMIEKFLNDDEKAKPKILIKCTVKILVLRHRIL